MKLVVNRLSDNKVSTIGALYIDGVFQCLDSRVFGEKHIKLWVRSNSATPPLTALVFNGISHNLFPTPGNMLRIAYQLDVNQYQNNRSLQLLVKYFEEL